MDYPQISVLLPVYNCENYIKDCIDSILNQTFSDFELLIIDDKSTDNTVKIIQQFNDDRIKLTIKEKNSGITNSLNLGIDQAKGKYIARMDGDDICLPQRFEKQKSFLDANDDIILCGTAIQIIDSNKILTHPVNHNEIITKLCFNTSFCHPSIMVRKEILLNNKYNKKFEHAEDYELWTRLASIGRLANIDEVLLLYRVHENQISKIMNETQSYNAIYCKLNMLNYLQVKEIFTEKQIVNALSRPINYSFHDCEEALKVFKYLLLENNKRKVFDQELFSKKLQDYKINFLKRYIEVGKHQKLVKLFFLIRKVSFREFLKIATISKRLKNRFTKNL